MTKEETERFYEQNKRKYCIKDNKPFLAWLNKIIEKGYDTFINVDELQRLIDYIAAWYEFKYPERQLVDYKDIHEFSEIKNLSKRFSMDQLLYRLSNRQVSLVRCRYRSNNVVRDIYNNKGKVIGQRTSIFMSIPRNNSKIYIGREVPAIRLYADDVNGDVEINETLKNYVNSDSINLEQLLELLKTNYSDVLELAKLEKCIYNHKCDLELRKGILQLVALRLLYSNNTIPEIGYKRSIKFIDEFNKELDLNLSKDEIDEIINKDYTVKKFKKSIFRFNKAN